MLNQATEASKPHILAPANASKQTYPTSLYKRNNIMHQCLRILKTP